MGERRPIREVKTLQELLHAVGNSLSIISSNAQYLLGKRPPLPGGEELAIVWDEAERAAALLRMVPQAMAELPLWETEEPPHGKK